MNITFRKATIADCYALAVLKGIVWNATYKGIYSDDTLANYDVPKNQAIFESIVANPDIELYVAECDQQIVGLMTCGKPFKPFMHYEQEIGLLYILKAYQRLGIGKSFFNIARNQTLKQGHTEFFVSVNKQNSNAISFYLAMGGKIILEDDKQLKICYTV